MMGNVFIKSNYQNEVGEFLKNWYEAFLQLLGFFNRGNIGRFV